MKIGDLAVWTQKAAQWSNGPAAGELAGIVIGYQKSRRASGRHRRSRVRLHDGMEAFYISPDFVEVANENG